MSLVDSKILATKMRARRILKFFGWTLFTCIVVVGLSAAWFYIVGPQPPVITGLENDPGAALDVAQAQAQVKKWPFRASKWGRLGKILDEYEYKRDAITCFSRAGELDSADPRWPYLEGRLCRDFDLDRAVVLLEHAADLEKSNTTARLLLAETLLQVERIDEAEKHDQFVLRHDPDNARALQGLGRIADHRGDLTASRDYLQRSASSAPKIGETHLLLAKVFLRLGDKHRAAREVQLADPQIATGNFPDPYQKLDGSPLRGRKQVQNRAQALIEKGRADEAIELLKQLPQSGMGAVRTNLLLARAYVSLQKLDAAVQTYRAALAAKPDHVGLLSGLAATLEKQGNYAAAAENLRSVIRLKPTAVVSHQQLGRCLERLGQAGEAIDEYREAIRLRPSFAAAHSSLGSLLISRGQKTEGLAELEKASQLTQLDEAERRKSDGAPRRQEPQDDVQ